MRTKKAPAATARLKREMDRSQEGYWAIARAMRGRLAVVGVCAFVLGAIGGALCVIAAVYY